MENIPNPNQLFNHIFNENTKLEMLNIVQYSLISIVPIVVLNKTMAYYIPEADESKDTIEILLEIFVQVIFMFVGIYIVHRMVIFIPPSSGLQYYELNMTHIILSVLLLILSLQTKIGEKVSILSQRVWMFFHQQRDGLQTLVPSDSIPRSIQPLAQTTTTTPLSQLQPQPQMQIQPQPQQMQIQPQQMQIQPQQQPQQQPMKYTTSIPQQNFDSISPYTSGDKFGQW